MLEWLGRWLIILGLDFGYFPDKVATVLTYILYNGCMIIITGGLWVFWMIFRDTKKLIKFKRREKK